MCFSAPASFLAASVTGAAGAAALARVHRREEIPLAAMPLFFAAQQTIEGFLWLSLDASPGEPPSFLLTQLFLHFALVFWPVYAPLSALLVEPDPRRRQWIGICLIGGIIVGIYFLWSLHASPRMASIGSGHIVYSSDPGLPMAVRILYPVATCIAPLLSSLRTVRILAAILIAASLVAYLEYWQAFTSVWCYFAAAASGVILFQFEQARQKRRVAALRAD
jgi:hypothetical protein